MKYIYTIIIILLLIIAIPKKENKFKFNIENMDLEEINYYCKSNNLKCNIIYEYNKIKKDSIINQNIPNDTKITKKENINITVSKGMQELYEKYQVNELGRIPVMMYHGIHNISNDETKYIGGNIDINGYQRTVEAFKKDLEFYYNNDYRMIRLNDYINGIIDVEIGKSPIVLTFDDGLKNNFNVLGLDEKGELIIDPNCAIGILEEYKKKYKDFNVTATFFLNGQLFEQEKYNDKILKWLIENGYDIGNHTYNHVDFSKINKEQTIKEIDEMYKKLDSIIQNKYVNIVALPFGSPYKIEHENFEHILKTNTISTLRVGWESDYSPFTKEFNKTFIKRIRAYDNNGKEFDIEHNFKMLEKTRYISDGDKELIVFKKENKSLFNDYNNNYVTY